jgi:DNA-binding MarR family transcriptional regulator
MCFAVYSANLAYGRAYKPILEALGLTYTQWITIVALWEEDNQTVKSLGEKLFLESNTLTPMLKKLEELGYLRRRRDPDDERQVIVSLTEEGRRLREKGAQRTLVKATGMDADEFAGDAEGDRQAPQQSDHARAEVTARVRPGTRSYRKKAECPGDVGSGDLSNGRNRREVKTCFQATRQVSQSAPTEPRLCKRERACWRGASREWWAGPPGRKQPRRWQAPLPARRDPEGLCPRHWRGQL